MSMAKYEKQDRINRIFMINRIIDCLDDCHERHSIL
jgi:hypothetical protein